MAIDEKIMPKSKKAYEIYERIVRDNPTFYELLDSYGFCQNTYGRYIRHLEGVPEETIKKMKDRLYNREFCLAIEDFMKNKEVWEGRASILLELISKQMEKKYIDFDMKHYDLFLDINTWMFSYKVFVTKLFSCQKYFDDITIIDCGCIDKNVKESRKVKIIKEVK